MLGLVSIGVICLVALPFELLVDINSWVRLFAVGIAAGILALLVNFFCGAAKDGTPDGA